MQWTDEQPKKRGHYWYRDAGVECVVVVANFGPEEAECFQVFFPSQIPMPAQEHRQFMDQLKGQWAGPLPVSKNGKLLEPIPKPEASLTLTTWQRFWGRVTGIRKHLVN
jgi:hypothetical protein